MAKIVRYNGNLVPFASSALGTERTIFGQVTQANDITSQYTAEFLRGWGTVGPSDQPTLQDFNAVSYTHGQILSYLHQVGIAEYNALQEYYIGSLTNQSGAIYASLTDGNIGNTPSSSPSNWRPVSNAAAVDATGVRMTVATASASATMAADSVVAGTTLDGQSFRIASYSKVINLATVGAGGMDVGAAPVNGWVALYAIYNPTSGASSILAVNSPNTNMPPVYGGANMPAGYTASALLTVVPTNASSQFKPLRVAGKNVFIALSTAYTGSASVVNNPISIASIVPGNAKEILNGELSISNTVSSAMSLTIFADGTTPFGQQNVTALLATGSAMTVNYSHLPLITPQQMAFTSSSSAGTPTYTIFIGGYVL